MQGVRHAYKSLCFISVLLLLIFMGLFENFEKHVKKEAVPKNETKSLIEKIDEEALADFDNLEQKVEYLQEVRYMDLTKFNRTVNELRKEIENLNKELITERRSCGRKLHNYLSLEIDDVKDTDTTKKPLKEVNCSRVNWELIGKVQELKHELETLRQVQSKEAQECELKIKECLEGAVTTMDRRSDSSEEQHLQCEEAKAKLSAFEAARAKEFSECKASNTDTSISCLRAARFKDQLKCAASLEGLKRKFFDLQRQFESIKSKPIDYGTLE